MVLWRSPWKNKSCRQCGGGLPVALLQPRLGRPRVGMGGSFLPLLVSRSWCCGGFRTAARGPGSRPSRGSESWHLPVSHLSVTRGWFLPRGRSAPEVFAHVLLSSGQGYFLPMYQMTLWDRDDWKCFPALILVLAFGLPQHFIFCLVLWFILRALLFPKYVKTSQKVCVCCAYVPT